jgi:CRP-like cAMP-binding protein
MASDTVLSGDLSFMSLADLLQMLGSNGSSGILRLRNEQIAEPGLIYFNNGNPIHAICTPKTGLEALYTLFGWVAGEFAFSREKFNVSQTIQQSRMEIILDGLRKLDDGEVPRVGAAATIAPSKARSAASGVIRGPLVDYMSVVDEEHFAPGTRIVKEGSYGNWIWVILEGQVDIFRETPSGPCKLISLGEGAFIGSLSAFSIHGHIRTESCVAATKVVLGVLDLQRLATEYTRMSHAMRRLGLSLDRRLRQLNTRIVESHQEPAELEAMLKDFEPMASGEDQPVDGLYLITDGRALVVLEKEDQHLLLAKLEANDVFGLIPFADIGHEPYAATVLVDKSAKLTRLDSDALQAEFEQMSTTFKNLFENLVIAMSVTTRSALKEVSRGD